MHIHRHEDGEGQLADLTYFCSDFCHQTWCADTGAIYGGWDGCHGDAPATVCASCGDSVGFTAE